MKAHQAEYPVSTMCRALGVSPSGLYGWLHRVPSSRAVEDAKLTERIVRIHASSFDTYGAPRVLAELRDEGVPVGRKRVARLMEAEGLQGVRRRRVHRTTTRDTLQPL